MDGICRSATRPARPARPHKQEAFKAARLTFATPPGRKCRSSGGSRRARHRRQTAAGPRTASLDPAVSRHAIWIDDPGMFRPDLDAHRRRRCWHRETRGRNDRPLDPGSAAEHPVPAGFAIWASSSIDITLDLTARGRMINCGREPHAGAGPRFDLGWGRTAAAASTRNQAI
jgi:hypothetical protein